MNKKQSNLIKKIEAKGFKPVDISNYENPNSLIEVQCENGHKLKTSWKYMRSEHFKCTQCYGGEYKFSNPKTAPDKKPGTYRIIALDNATEETGLSIFDNGELVFYSIIRFEGLLADRLLGAYDVITQVIINQWKPDYVILEDVQLQQNKQTYKTLAKMLGVIIVALRKYNIEFTILGANVWRKFYQISQARSLAKHEAVQKVKLMYDITVQHDIAEAILMGRYAADELQDRWVKRGF